MPMKEKVAWRKQIRPVPYRDYFGFVFPEVLCNKILVYYNKLFRRFSFKLNYFKPKIPTTFLVAAIKEAPYSFQYISVF
jgi:hypothetical protein